MPSSNQRANHCLLIGPTCDWRGSICSQWYFSRLKSRSPCEDTLSDYYFIVNSGLFNRHTTTLYIIFVIITAVRFLTPLQSLYYVFSMCNDGTILLFVLEEQLYFWGSGIQTTHLCKDGAFISYGDLFEQFVFRVKHISGNIY